MSTDLLEFDLVPLADLNQRSLPQLNLVLLPPLYQELRPSVPLVVVRLHDTDEDAYSHQGGDVEVGYADNIRVDEKVYGSGT